ncbi:putative F-box domain-containing protein [Rosa chinensis]|uniref:Putative F-box domain-containing protein n=1 Tax=Rosa chinensis TaxID=74649 RepID=A0A2P6QLM3_ROSCH|nr:F-box/kelch-repeat protein At3g06240 [Rosa chinensis]PRQ35075.1 putative F-box domain-containing protein [Rosa chinensis]
MSSCVVDLPEDIIVKILCRLPVKSLIRFTCVSKRWRSLIISDPKFGKSHFQFASQQKTLRRKVLLTSYPAVIEPGSTPNACYDGSWKKWAEDKFITLFQSLDDKFSVKNFTFPSEEIEDLEEMGSCNGLVLVGRPCRDHYKSLFIWNPSTGFFRKIPHPSFRMKSGRYFLNYGFGHVSASDDYKLVSVVPAPNDMLEVHIFSLSANIWKVITAPYSSYPCWVNRHGTFSNGAIHWVTPCGNKTLDPVIYAFSLAEEEFRRVPLPPVLWQNEEDRNPTKITTLVHLGGYLCIWSRKCFDTQGGEVWAMTEYGVPESWVKLFQFNIHDFRNVFDVEQSPWDLCFITEGDTMVLRLNKELLWIECRNEEKPVCSGRYRLEKVQPKLSNLAFYFRATIYDETLVSVAE